MDINHLINSGCIIGLDDEEPLEKNAYSDSDDEETDKLVESTKNIDLSGFQELRASTCEQTEIQNAFDKVKAKTAKKAALKKQISLQKPITPVKPKRATKDDEVYSVSKSKLKKMLTKFNSNIESNIQPKIAPPSRKLKADELRCSRCKKVYNFEENYVTPSGIPTMRARCPACDISIRRSTPRSKLSKDEIEKIELSRLQKIIGRSYTRKIDPSE